MPVELVERRPIVCLTIANIITPQEYERTGIFTRTIKQIRKITGWPIFLENTRRDWADRLLAGYGWQSAKTYQSSWAGEKDLILMGTGQKVV